MEPKITTTPKKCASVVCMADVHPRLMRFSPVGAVTWEGLVNECPALSVVQDGILARQSAMSKSANHCANSFWYSSVKPILTHMIGGGSMARCDSVLCTSEAYDVAYDHLWNLVPDCNHGGMCWG
jgi:hypothetical protein